MADPVAVADQDSGWIDVPPAPAPQQASQQDDSDSGWVDVPSVKAQPKPQAQPQQQQQQAKGPNVKPGVSDDELIRSFGYKPEVIKASPLYQQAAKQTGEGNVFQSILTPQGGTGQRILSGPAGGFLYGLSNIASGGVQAGTHLLNKLGIGQADAPYVDLLGKVWRQNYQQNALQGQAPGALATVGQIAGEAVPALALAPLTGGGSLLGAVGTGALTGGVEGMMLPVDVDPNDPDSYSRQKTGQVIGGATTGALFGGGGKLTARIAKIPFASKALDKVAQAAGSVPIDINGPGMAALDAEAYSQTGSHLPKVVNDFLNRIGPGKPPLTFAEARDFYKNTTALSDEEARKVTKLMWPYVKTFRQELHNSLQQAADKVGMGDQYDSAIRAYSQGMMAKRFAGWLAKSAAGRTWTGRVGWGAELLNYLSRNKAEGGLILDRYPSREAILASLQGR